MKCHPPRTIADHTQITEWVMMGLSNEEVFNRMTNSIWRSETVIIQGHEFCAACSRYIVLDWCIHCGQTSSVSALEFFEWLEFQEFIRKNKARRQTGFSRY